MTNKEIKDRIREYAARGAKSEAIAFLERCAAEAEAQKCLPPSDDAMRCLQVLQMRGHATTEDIKAMLQTHGANYLVYEQLADIGTKCGAWDLFTPAHPLDVQAEGCKKTIYNISEILQPDQEITDGQKGVLSMCLDSYLPD